MSRSSRVLAIDVSLLVHRSFRSTPASGAEPQPVASFDAGTDQRQRFAAIERSVIARDRSRPVRDPPVVSDVSGVRAPSRTRRRDRIARELEIRLRDTLAVRPRRGRPRRPRARAARRRARALGRRSVWNRARNLSLARATGVEDGPRRVEVARVGGFFPSAGFDARERASSAREGRNSLERGRLARERGSTRSSERSWWRFETRA